MSKQKKASFETSVRSNRIVLASSIPIDLARMYFIQSPQSFADRSPTNHTQFLSCNRPGRQPTRQPQTELWQTARAGQNQPYHLRPYLLTYLLTPAFLTFVHTCVVIFLPATYFHIRRHHSLHCHQKWLWNCDNSSNRLQLPSPTMHVCIIITSLVWISLLLSSLQLPLYSHNLAAVLGLIAVNAPFFSSLFSVGWMLPGLRLGGGILIIHQSVSSIYLVISFCVIFYFLSIKIETNVSLSSRSKTDYHLKWPKFCREKRAVLMTGTEFWSKFGPFLHVKYDHIY